MPRRLSVVRMGGIGRDSDDALRPEVAPLWKHDGVRVIKGDRLDPNTAQTPGMFRQAAINPARVGAQKIWAGTVAIQPNAKTGVHHHGALESVIFVVRAAPGCAGASGSNIVAEAEPGRLHLRAALRAAPGDQRRPGPSRCECVLVRSDNEAVVVNIPDVDAGRDSPRRSTGSIRSTAHRKADLPFTETAPEWTRRISNESTQAGP